MTLLLLLQDLIGNTKANLQLIFNKLVDDEHLPDVAADATKVIQAWLTELLWRHPNLDPGRATHSSSRRSGQQQQHGKQLHLDVHVTGVLQGLQQLFHTLLVLRCHSSVIMLCWWSASAMHKPGVFCG